MQSGTVFVDYRIDVLSLALETDPIVESRPARIVEAHVPFSDEGGLVASLTESPGEGIKRMADDVDPQPVVIRDQVFVGILTCQEARSTGRAKRARHEELGEARTLVGEAINVRRLQVGIARDAEPVGALIIGDDAPRIANTSCIALPGKPAETMVIKLDLEGVAVSAGSACSSGKVGTSHVLEAMGLAPEIARSAIRVSLGSDTQDEDIAAFLAAWEKVSGAAAVAA